MKKIFVLAFAILLTVNVYPQKNLTLDEAIAIALKQNTSLIKTKNSIEGSEKKVVSAYGDFLPNFGLRGSWTWSRTSDDGGPQLDYLGNPVVIPAYKNDTRNYSVSAGGNWILFDGLSNLANLSASKDELKAAKYDLNKLKQDIVLQTKNLYYNVLNANEQLKVWQDNVKFNSKLFETIKEKNRLGSIAAADVYTQQVQLGNAELALIQAQNTLEYAQIALLDYLSMDVLAEYIFVDPRTEESENDDEFMKEFSNVAEMVASALENRYDYKSQQLYVKAAKSGITMARGGYFPSLSGNYGFSTRAVKLNQVFDRREYSLGLTLNIPIFSNFNTEYSVQLAKIGFKNSKEDLLAKERAIKIQIKQGYQDLIAAKKAYDVSKENVKAAEERRKIDYERYNLGAGTILDVLQADRDFTQASSDAIDVEFSFYRSVDNLKNFLGNLEYKKYE